VLHIAHASKPCQVCDATTEGKPAITVYKIYNSALRRQCLIDTRKTWHLRDTTRTGKR